MQRVQGRGLRLDARFAIHAALTLDMAWLAVILAMPGDTFAQARGWSEFAKLGPENCWAMAFWLVASLGAVGLSTPSRAVRLFGVLVLSSTYGVIAGLMLWGAPSGSGSGTYAVLAVLGCYLAWRGAAEEA